MCDSGSADPEGYDFVVNATPLGMKEGDRWPMTWSASHLRPFVGEVVIEGEITPFLAAVRAKGCDYQIGTDMLFDRFRPTSNFRLARRRRMNFARSLRFIMLS